MPLLVRFLGIFLHTISDTLPMCACVSGRFCQRVWNRSETAVNCSPSQTLCLFGYSVIAVELQEKFVDCVIWFHYWTASKHLPPHHLRLHILFLQNWFQVNFLTPVFLRNHAHKKSFQNFKSDWNADRARARKGEAQELLNGNNPKGITATPSSVF